MAVSIFAYFDIFLLYCIAYPKSLAEMDTGPKGFDIGKRNYLAIRKILWKNGMFIDAEDIGGGSPRNMYMNIANGVVTIRSNGLEKNL